MAKRKRYPTLTIWKLGKSLDDPPEQVTEITLWADNFMIGPLPTDGVLLIQYQRPKRRP